MPARRNGRHAIVNVILAVIALVAAATAIPVYAAADQALAITGNRDRGNPNPGVIPNAYELNVTHGRH